MNREEAIAAGMEVHEIQHSMKRRTPWHDYSRKGTYMLTLVVRERMPILGTLRGCLEGEGRAAEDKPILPFGGGVETVHYARPLAHDCKNQREHGGE